MNLDEQHRSALAQYQAAWTHGHPTALAASDLTAHSVYLLLNGCKVSELLDELIDYTKRQRSVYHGDWLGKLHERAGKCPKDFIEEGWDECMKILERLLSTLSSANPAEDPCLLGGEGWIAEEALASALVCFIQYSTHSSFSLAPIS